jgi:hypothetical protein
MVAPAPNSKAVAEIAPPQAPSIPFVQGNHVFADQNDNSWAFWRRRAKMLYRGGTLRVADTTIRVSPARRQLACANFALSASLSWSGCMVTAIRG